MDQETWNLLFSWITGRRCFLPEGCPPPVEGVIFYSLAVAAAAGVFYYLYRRGAPGWRR